MKWLGKFPDPFLTEIAGQPGALRRAASALAGQRPVLEALARRASRTGGSVLTGMGSSYHACYPAVNELAARGILAAHVDTAELLHFRSHVLSPETALVVVSQSGESAEVVRLAESLAARGDRPLVLSITNGLGNGLAERADLCLDTLAGTEAGPSTMTFAASMAQLAAVAGVLARETPTSAIERARTSAAAAAAAVERCLSEGERIADLLAKTVGGREVVAVLGRGPARAAAEMGALTLKECGVVAESFATAAFRHGPFELAGPDLAAIVVATEPETRELDLGLAADLLEAGASVAIVYHGGELPAGATGIRTEPVDRLLGSAVSIVPIQLLAWRLAAERGREPGTYTRARPR